MDRAVEVLYLILFGLARVSLSSVTAFGWSVKLLYAIASLCGNAYLRLDRQPPQIFLVLKGLNLPRAIPHSGLLFRA